MKWMSINKFSHLVKHFKTFLHCFAKTNEDEKSQIFPNFQLQRSIMVPHCVTKTKLNKCEQVQNF